MNLVNLSEIPDGVRFDVLAKPKASRNAIIGVHDGALKIAITAAPEKGKANKAIVNLLSRLLKIPKNSIKIVSGETSSRKIIAIEGVSSEMINKLVKENDG